MPLPNGNLLVFGEEIDPRLLPVMADNSLTSEELANINFAAACLATKKHPAEEIRRRLEQMTPAQRRKFYNQVDELFEQALTWYPVLH